MKTLLSFTIITFLVLTTSCGQAQNNDSKKQTETMLLEFYTKHFEILKTPLPSDVRFEKLDSLMRKYCTSNLRKEATEVFENVGADFLTDDKVGDLNESLEVKKESGNENVYIVSFISDIALYSDVPGETTKKQIVLYVTVVKEGEFYKIADVR